MHKEHIVTVVLTDRDLRTVERIVVVVGAGEIADTSIKGAPAQITRIPILRAEMQSMTMAPLHS